LAALPGLTAIVAQEQKFGDAQPSGRMLLVESEPNDTLPQADAIAFGDSMNGELGPTGDNDYFKFHAIDDAQPWIVVQSSEANVAVCLLNTAGQTLACNDDWSGWETDARMTLVITPGDYYIKVYGIGTGAYHMTLQDRMLRENRVVNGVLWNDYYAEVCTNDHIFLKVVESGNILIEINTWSHTTVGTVEVLGKFYDLNSPADRVIDFGVLAPGLYDIHFSGDFSRDLNTCYSYSVAASRPLLISAAAANLGTGTVAGISFRSEDILAYSKFDDGNERWAMFFDGSDVGVKTLANFGIDSGGGIRFTIGGKQTLPGVDAVTPWDIIIFEAEQYGEETQGTFRMGFDGSEHQLTTSSEKLDAIAESRYCEFLSTTGTARVPFYMGYDIRFKDEDLGCWYQEVEWLYGFEGRFVKGLPVEDVVAASYNNGTADMYLTILGNGIIAGHRVTQKDIFAISYNDYTWGGYVWRGPQHGWNYKIDAFEFGGW
jgi:hypothetical protein